MSAVRYIYSTSGEYVAFVQGRDMFSPSGNWIGRLVTGNEVFKPDGTFLGYLNSDDRIVRRRGERKPIRSVGFPPFRPFLPFRPFRRLKMPRLPHPYEDVFNAVGPLQSMAEALPDLSHLEGGRIVAFDGTFLGRISKNRFDAESIGNSFGAYGSRYSVNSIHNPYGPYGGPYGAHSPFNPYSTSAPSVEVGGRIVGRLSKNIHLRPRIDPDELNEWIASG